MRVMCNICLSLLSLTALTDTDIFNFPLSLAGVRVVRYPCLDPRAAFINLAAHSMHTTNVRFNADDSYLFTIGGTDRALIQWRLAGDRTNRLLMAGLSAED